MSLEAVVFDFDGLILDTEWPIYEMAAAAFATFGIEVTVADWAQVVGLADVDHGWFELLQGQLGFGISKAEFQVEFAAQDRTYRDRLQPLPGVIALVDALTDAEVPLAIASSSPFDWLDRHLSRVGLRDRFTELVGLDHGEVGGLGKPDPAVYRVACRGLGVDPKGVVALEDSAHGVQAARTAGLHAIAVPNRITRYSSFDHATLVVPSLEEVTVDGLRRLVALEA
jgi:HAD superfamily hydrolase (TIGR01509 family)